MNIQSTKPSLKRQLSKMPQAQPKAAEQEPSPQEPKETSAIQIGHRAGVAKATKWSESFTPVTGGIIGFGTAIPGAYAGLMGGTVAGAVAGLSMGPAVGVLQGKAGLDLLKTVFSTGGTVAKAFMVTGVAAGALGGWMVGRRIGEYVAAAPITALAYPIGFAHGAVTGKAPELPEQPKKKESTVELVRQRHGMTKGLSGLVGGVGAISVGLGGAAIGAGAAGGISLIAGLLAGDVNLAALGTAALIGGGVGVATGAVLGGIGGSTMVNKASDVLAWSKNKIFPDKEGQAIEDLKQKVAKKQGDFEALAGRLDTETDAASADFAANQTALEERQADTAKYVETQHGVVESLRREGEQYESDVNQGLAERQTKLDDANTKIETTIEADADERFAQKRIPTDKKYDDLHEELDGIRDAHQERDDHISKIENEQAADIEAKVVKSYEEKMVPVDQHYAELHQEQDARESDLKDWDQRVVAENQRLDDEITQKGQANFKSREPALEQEFVGHEGDLRADFRGKTQDASQQHDSDVKAADQKHRQDMSSASSQHQSDMTRADNEHRQAIRSETDSHDRAMETEKSNHSDSMRRLDREFEQKMDRLERDHRSRMTALNSKLSRLESDERELEREKPNLERQLSAAERDLRDARSALREVESRWDREVGAAERERNNAVSERNATSRELSSANSEIREAENEKSKWVRQKAQVDALIPGLRAERDRLKKILDKMD